MSLLVVVWVVRRNYRGRFGFHGFSVLSGSSGDQLSFNTTVGDVVLSK